MTGLQAQECCEGGSLRRLIEKAASGTGKRLYAYRDALRWSSQVADALAYLHNHNPQVVHRDLVRSCSSSMTCAASTAARFRIIQQLTVVYADSSSAAAVY